MNDWPLWLVIATYKNPYFAWLPDEPRIITEESYVRARTADEAERAIDRFVGFREEPLIGVSVTRA